MTTQHHPASKLINVPKLKLYVGKMKSTRSALKGISLNHSSAWTLFSKTERLKADWLTVKAARANVKCHKHCFYSKLSCGGLNSD